MTPVDVAGGPQGSSERRHLTLVSVAVIVPKEEGGGEEEGGGVASSGPKHRRPDPPGGSSTLRALMALGALATAIGIGSAQLAAANPPRTRASAPPRDETAPETGRSALVETAPGTGQPARTGHRTPVVGEAVSRPPANKSHTSSRIRSTEPKARQLTVNAAVTVVAAAYTLPEGTGKHRKPTTATYSDPCGRNAGYVGRHRGHRDGGYEHLHRHDNDHDHDRDRAGYGHRQGMLAAGLTHSV
jgi:hypothetical protein